MISNPPEQPPLPNTLYHKLLAETAKIDWRELERFFSLGRLIHVDPQMDLVYVAQTIAEDKVALITEWLNAGTIKKVDDQLALDLSQRRPELWAVAVSPWICVQEKKSS